MKLSTKTKRALSKAYGEMLLWVSPRRANIRNHFKRLENDTDYRTAFLLGMRIRGYRAGKQGTSWLGGSNSADGEILTELPAIRNRSRELMRDDPIASGLCGTFVNNVIGSGINAQVRTDDPEKNKRIESVWNELKDKLYQADALTHIEGQRLLITKWFEDGEVLVKGVLSNRGEPLWFEIVEADRLATPHSKSNDGNIRDGVERDRFSRPAFYWICKEHPGESYKGFSESDFVRVPAYGVRHLKVTKRPGQTRGVPTMHAVMQDLRDLDLLMLACLKRTQIAACLSVFIKSENNASLLLEATAQKYGYVLDQQIEPGMIFKLSPGEEISTLVPNFPVPELESFVIMLARRIGTALGVSWQVVLKDFAKSNYSSARTDLLEARQVYHVIQRWFIEKYLSWEWERVMQDALLRGDSRLNGVTQDDLKAITWITPGWQWVDPQREANATKIKLETRITTLRDVCAATGQDWEEIQDQLLREELREKKRREELGIPKSEPSDLAQPNNAPKPKPKPKAKPRAK